MLPKRIPPVAWFILAAFAAGTIGSFATYSSVNTWYPTLRKPTWTPPGWLFGPVWTGLYVAMGIAAWRVWGKVRPNEARSVLRLYALQLVLNAGWSVIFFGLRQPGWALADVLALWIILVGMLLKFFAVDRFAGALWAAYVGWVSFATLLNAAVWRLNSGTP